MSVTPLATRQARERLDRARPPGALVRRVRASVEGDTIAVALYGSHAQGTAGRGSDVDVLQVTPGRPRSYSVGPVNVTAYTPAALLEMARRGSLFVLHLCQDAMIVSDPRGVLATCLAAYRPPHSYEPLYEELRAAGAALHPVEDSGRYTTGLTRLGVYLVRTAMYARLAEQGTPVFVVSEAVDRLDRPHIASALALRHKQDTDAGDLRELLAALDELVGPVALNRSGSIEGLAVSLAGVRPYAADLLAQTLAGGEQSLQYTALMPPFLL